MAAIKTRSEQTDVKVLVHLWLIVILFLSLMGRPDVVSKRDGLRERLSLFSRWQRAYSTPLALSCIAGLCGVSVYMVPVYWAKGLWEARSRYDGPPMLMFVPLLLIGDESRLGDLTEEFHDLAKAEGRSRAARYVTGQAWQYGWKALGERSRVGMRWLVTIAVEILVKWFVQR